MGHIALHRANRNGIGDTGVGNCSGERSPAGVRGPVAPRTPCSARCGGKAATTGQKRTSWSGTAPPNQPTGTVTRCRSFSSMFYACIKSLHSLLGLPPHRLAAISQEDR